MRGVRAFVAVALVLATTEHASAHTGLPHIDRILVSENETHVVAVSDDWGQFHSFDGGQTYGFVCAEAWGGRSNRHERRSAVFAQDGTLYVASAFEGLQRTRDGCEWERVAFFEDPAGCGGASCVVVDVELRSGGRLYALTATGTPAGDVHNVAFVSEDDGVTWRPTFEPADTDWVATDLGTGGGIAGASYVAGRIIGGPPVIYRWDSYAGPSWVRIVVADPPVDTTVGWTPRIAAIHPADAARIHYTIDFEHDRGDSPGDWIVLSADGGQFWFPPVVLDGDLSSLEYSHDSANLWLSGPTDGLWVAEAGGATIFPGAFRQVLDEEIYGVSWIGGVQYVGTEEFTPEGLGASIGRLLDNGASLEPVMSLCDVDLLACGPGTNVGQLCPGQWAWFVDNLLTPGCDQTTGGAASGDPAGVDPTPVDGDAAPIDSPIAGQPSTAAEPSNGVRSQGVDSGAVSGCGCRATGSPPRGGALLAMLAVALTATRRRTPNLNLVPSADGVASSTRSGRGRVRATARRDERQERSQYRWTSYR